MLVRWGAIGKLWAKDGLELQQDHPVYWELASRTNTREPEQKQGTELEGHWSNFLANLASQLKFYILKVWQLEF